MTPNNLISVASFIPKSLQFPNAWVGHLPFAAWIIQEASPKIFVELGTHSGNSYFAFCQSVAENNLSSKCYAVDTWQGDEHAGQYNDEVFAGVNAHNAEHYSEFSRLLRMTFDDAAGYFSDASIDLLHIDGLHTYEAVRHDFETWLPKLAPGAVVMFHDTNVRERNFGVWKLWEELQASHPNNLEFVHSHGLGVMQLNNAPKEDKRLEWLHPSSPEKQRLKNYFAALGLRQLERFELNEHKATLNQTIAERDGQVASLNQAVAERDGQITKLSQAVAERDEQITNLNQSVSERDGQVASLNQAVAERDGQITKLSQAVAERDGQITKLIDERDSAIANSAALRRSMSWRLTTPFRFVGHIIKGDFKTAANVIRVIFSISEQQRTLKGQTLPIWKRLALVVKGSRLASGIRFIHYGFIRGRDWYARNSRLPRMEELIALVKRAAAEYHNRLQVINEALLLTDFVLPKQLDPYQSWIIANQNSERAYEQCTRLRHALGILPKISVVMPVYNPPQEFFELAVASLRNQIYENWELCIADDASTAPWLRQRLHELADDDKRIRICFRERNGNISLASNSAAELATGDFLLFFDQDDLLTIDALAEVALYLAEHTTTDVLYSDDDKIDSDGKRFAPQFKPDWSPELLLSYMYISHLFVVRRTLFEAVNGFRQGFEGSQDYDLALRVTERARSIAHLPYVLYHWRVLPGSTATSGDAKPASFEAGRRAVAEAFARRGVEVTVFRPDWAIKGAMGVFWHNFSDEGPSVSIIIPTKNQKEIFKRCVDSLTKTTYRNFEMVIIDNGSDDQDTLSYLDSLRCRVLKIQNPTEKFNYAYINNRAVEQVNSRYVLFLNNDTEVQDPKWLSRMVGYAGLAGVGAVGARLLYPDGRIQHAGIIHGYYDGMAGPAFKLLPSWHHGYLSYGMVTRNYSAVTAACLLTPRQFFLEHGGFDEKQFSVAYNDVDYCYRLVDSGLRCVYSPGSELYHHEGFSRGFKDDPREVLAFRRKYSGRIDRYYNPNLSLLNEQFEIQPRRIVRLEEGRPIRALMCAFNLNLEGAPYSQYEMTIDLVSKGVIAPVVYSPMDGPLRSLYERAGIEVIVQTHPLNGVFTIDAYDHAIDKFANWGRERKFEMVYGNTLQTFYAIDAARRCGLPSLWNVRESEPWQTYFNYLPSPIKARALSCFSFPYRIIFVAHATRSRFEPLNSERNFCMIHNGLNLHRLEESRARWGRAKARKALQLDDDEIMVLLLGTVCSRKGQKDIIEAMPLLSNDVVQKMRLFIVGDRPSSYSSEIRAMVSALPKELSKKISIISETAETAPYYSAADIFVCTSRIESYPRVILEAMAYGLPIISTPAFGIVEQVRDGVNGEFYQEGNVVELSSKLKNLILHNVKREAYQINSKIVLESLTSFEEMINQYAELFRESVAISLYDRNLIDEREG